MANPAAFRRLCVETSRINYKHAWIVPAAFRRLCVETDNLGFYSFLCWPAAFRRLCVETIIKRILIIPF